MKKKILFFFPENPISNNAGNKIRAYSILKYLNSRNFIIDFISVSNIQGQSQKQWKDSDIENLIKEKIVDKVFILEKDKCFSSKYLFLSYFKKIICFILNKIIKKKSAPFKDLVSQSYKTQFRKILKKNSYDFIFINYAYWSSFVKKKKNIGNAKCIIDNHDFLTFQHI